MERSTAPDLDARLTQTSLIRWISSEQSDRVSASITDRHPAPPTGLPQALQPVTLEANHSCL